MSLKELLKSNIFLRRIVKRSKNYFEFLADAKDFSNHYSEIVEKNGDYSYRLMLLIHQLEKGMCRDNPRPFGQDKAKQIIGIIKKGNSDNQHSFEYELAKATLFSWKEMYDFQNWEMKPEISTFIDSIQNVELKAGRELMKAPKQEIESGKFENIIFSRRSVRDFSEQSLKREDIDFAIKCFISTPTACNRQMCKIYRVEEKEKKDLLINTILGIGGFNTNAMTLFLFTYDIGAFEFYGERNQGYVNVGLAAMNFVNGLHSRGIGSCFMQWSNKRADDIKIRKALGLPSRERIGLVLGAGYYKDETYIPCSTRKCKESLYQEI